MDTDNEIIHKQVNALMDLEEWEECIIMLNNSMDLVIFNWRLFWDLGWCYYKLDEFDKSINNFKSALNICPVDEKAFCLGFLGISLLANDNRSEAEDVLKQSLKIKDVTITRTALSLCLMKLNRIEESEAILIEGLKLNPNCKERLMSYANFLSDIGRHDEAAELYRKTI